MQSINKRAARIVLSAAVLAGASLTAGAQTYNEGPFKDMSGSWTGTGTVDVNNGSAERIRCRANYSVTPSGETLHQDLRCASDSFKFIVDSNVVADPSGSLSGTWTETTRQVTGAVSGTIRPGVIESSVKGTGFSAQLSVQTKGNSQSVTIRPQGTEITSVRIDMKRG